MDKEKGIEAIQTNRIAIRDVILYKQEVKGMVIHSSI